MQVYVVKAFRKFQEKHGVSDQNLQSAIEAMELGLIDASLGGKLYKQRVARDGEGKSGGFCAILMYRSARRAVFLCGFAKNKKASLTANELRVYLELASIFDAMITTQISALCQAGDLKEI
jgi:hypothetical protein